MSGGTRREPTTRRRTLLGGLALVGLGTLAGCTGPPGGDGPDGTEDMPARLRLKQVQPPDCENADPIRFADLSTAEQDLVETALEREEYAVPTEETSPAFDSLRESVEARSDTCGELVVYLRRGEAYYRVALVNGDNIIASTRPTPDRSTGS
jgi:hypothetical protein